MSQNQYDLQGKNVFITGGSMGIGFACAETCLEAGANVIICARNSGPLEDAVQKLKQNGMGKISSFVADVSNKGQVESLFQDITSQVERVDGVVHCAGVYGPIGDVTEIDPEEWLEAVRINLYGSFLIAREACKYFKTTGGGSVVLFSGGGAATPFPRFTAYACGKVGVVRLTETLAKEMEPFHIRVNCIAPGFVITRFHDQTLKAGERAGKQFLETTKKQIESGGVPPSVGAGAAAFLLSDEAKEISGKFVAAPYDGWASWPKYIKELAETDIFTLRRIIPKDRGMDWQ